MAGLPQYDFDEKPSSSSSNSSLNKVPLFAAIARVVTLASLVISLLVVQNIEVFVTAYAKIYYGSYNTYIYMHGVLIAGICYTVLLIPFAAYYLLAKKQLIDHQAFRWVEFIGDKIIFAILGSGCAASLAITVEFQKVEWSSGYVAKLRTFLALMHVPNAFLLAAFVSSLFSSIFSSLNLRKSE
ncbi:CASP-like protein 4D1 [Lycium ferocissimum]|uniref:CASP-like protein 4D1 n=1 Tax=Lycium ferocissimum TaxID=112874 RepID=UPI00281663D2|nr:CASP-like protein 4D1 [Lycium ferocissimum]